MGVALIVGNAEEDVETIGKLYEKDVHEAWGDVVGNAPEECAEEAPPRSA